MARARSWQRSTQRGAALLVALLILTLVSTLAAGMVWQQWRAIQVESAQRARTQSAWILGGALDWARLILREDARTGGVDSLNEPWARELKEAKITSFLALDRDNNSSAETGVDDAFISGSITDAQARWNLRRLVDATGKVVPAELRVFQRLCDTAGVPSGTAESVAAALARAWGPVSGLDRDARDSVPVGPMRLSQLVWLDVEPSTIARLDPYVVLLPAADTTVNVLTAPAEVIAAVVEGMSVGAAQRLVRERVRFAENGTNLETVRPYFPADPAPDLGGIGLTSRHFVVQGRLRQGDRVLEERSLVQRRQLEVVVLQREHVNLRDGS